MSSVFHNHFKQGFHSTSLTSIYIFLNINFFKAMACCKSGHYWQGHFLNVHTYSTLAALFQVHKSPSSCRSKGHCLTIPPWRFLRSYLTWLLLCFWTGFSAHRTLRPCTTPLIPDQWSCQKRSKWCSPSFLFWRHKTWASAVHENVPQLLSGKRNRWNEPPRNAH